MATSSGEEAIYVYNASQGELLKRIGVGKYPKGIKFDRVGRCAGSANEGSGSMCVIDAESLEVVREVKVERAPHTACFLRTTSGCT